MIKRVRSVDQTSDAALKSAALPLRMAGVKALHLTRIGFIKGINHPSPLRRQYLCAYARGSHLKLRAGDATIQRSTGKCHDIWKFFGQSGAHGARRAKFKTAVATIRSGKCQRKLALWTVPALVNQSLQALSVNPQSSRHLLGFTGLALRTRRDISVLAKLTPQKLIGQHIS